MNAEGEEEAASTARAGDSADDVRGGRAAGAGTTTAATARAETTFVSPRKLATMDDGIVLGPTMIAETVPADFVALSGHCIAIWSYADSYLTDVSTVMMKSDHDSVATIMSEIRSPAAREALVAKIAGQRLPPSDQICVENVLKFTRHSRKFRDRLAHYLYAGIEYKGSPFLALIDPKTWAQENAGRAAAYVAHKDSLDSGGWTDTGPAARDAIREDTDVYNLDELSNELDRMFTCCGYLLALRLMIEGHPRAAESRLLLSKPLEHPPAMRTPSPQTTNEPQSPPPSADPPGGP